MWKSYIAVHYSNPISTLLKLLQGFLWLHQLILSNFAYSTEPYSKHILQTWVTCCSIDSSESTMTLMFRAENAAAIVLSSTCTDRRQSGTRRSICRLPITTYSVLSSFSFNMLFAIHLCRSVMEDSIYPLDASWVLKMTAYV